MILIEKDGERQLVHNLSGYPGWAIIAESLPMPPSDCCRWKKDRWVECAQLEAKARAKAKAARLARVKATLGDELIAEITDEVTRRVEAASTRRGD